MGQGAFKARAEGGKEAGVNELNFAGPRNPAKIPRPKKIQFETNNNFVNNVDDSDDDDDEMCTDARRIAALEEQLRHKVN